MISLRRLANHLPKTSNYAFISTSCLLNKSSDRKEYLRSMPKPDEGVQSFEFVSNVQAKFEEIVSFPTPNTEYEKFNGIEYSELPIVHIKVSKNNTKLICLEPDNHRTIMFNTCGAEGFKNCRKGTNVAAQTTSINMGKKLQLKGIKTVKVAIKGLGPGRLASIQGLAASGINIVSITDLSYYDKLPKNRPPLPRRL